MILNQDTLHLFGEKLFERARITPPFKRANHLSNEACLLYKVKYYLKCGHDKLTFWIYMAELYSTDILLPCPHTHKQPSPISLTSISEKHHASRRKETLSLSTFQVEVTVNS